MPRRSVDAAGAGCRPALASQAAPAETLRGFIRTVPRCSVDAAGAGCSRGQPPHVAARALQQHARLQRRMAQAQVLRRPARQGLLRARCLPFSGGTRPSAQTVRLCSLQRGHTLATDGSSALMKAFNNNTGNQPVRKAASA